MFKKIMKTKINYGQHHIFKEDFKIIKNSLNENLITTGPYLKKFEKNLTNFLSVKNALVSSNGTSSLHLALMSINLKKNDTIIMPSINFISSYSMAKNCNAKIFLADVDEKFGYMTPKNLLDCIKKNKIKKIKAVIIMHHGGYPRYIGEFFRIKKKYNFFLIEDACHAFGASYFYNKKKYMIGSCAHSDICTFSFHPLKTITTGEGGALVTNSKEIFSKANLLRSHGIIRNKNKHWDYDIKDLGFNYRLSDINCALGLSQLKNIKKIINFRKKIYYFYLKKLLKNYYINEFSDTIHPSFHLITICSKFGVKSEIIIKKLKKKGIICQSHYKPIHKFSFFKKKLNLKNSEKFYLNSFSIPIHLNIKKAQLNFIVDTLNSI